MASIGPKVRLDELRRELQQPHAATASRVKLKASEFLIRTCRLCIAIDRNAMTEVPGYLKRHGGILIFMKIARLLVIVWLAGGMLACGQKGPLVMPDAQKHKRTIPTPVSAPAKATAHPASTPTPTDSSSRP